MQPINVKHHRMLERHMHGADVVFLHGLLNRHLGPPDDQLPVTGPEAGAFGPRTEAKVKKFQQIKKIDVGTAAFMDGKVGSHTWAALTKLRQVKVTISAVPRFQLTEPFSSFPKSFPSVPWAPPPASPRLKLSPEYSNFPDVLSGPRADPSRVRLVPDLRPPFSGGTITPPSWTCDNVQLQPGQQGTFPFGGGGITSSHSLQILAVCLDTNTTREIHPEIQFGPTILNNRGPGASSRTDVGLVGTLNIANLWGSGEIFNWSVQAQLALIKSLTNRSWSAQGSPLLQANLRLYAQNDKDVVQATVQAGPLFEADPPSASSDHRWHLKAGFVSFFGITVTLRDFNPTPL
jgi:Putative peptidoglycan binding domain